MYPTITLLVVSAALAAAERLPRLRFRPLPAWRRHAGTDLAYLVTGWLGGASLALAYTGGASDLVGRTLGLARWRDADVPLWASVALAVITLDLGNYLVHWALHRYAWLWEIHKIHHSSLQLDWLATFRSHLLEQALRRLLAPAVLIVAGAPSDAVAIGAIVFTAWAVLNHANLRFGSPALETVFVTPRVHRAHHVPETSDRNLGTVLTIWDRLRGTLVPGVYAPPVVYGVPAEVHTYPQGWVRQLGEPMRRIIRSRRRGLRPGEARSPRTAVAHGAAGPST